ncbi:hypothetical protein [Desulfitobacterium metallireducens]|uniref:Uncharacterized protein n=1 Tax=Desulfitobacterium metallireducens DSM 15288 TaxID=871968 RepID=W0ECE4_9FIRM|nr:hypothetical protein [Desulfitobacterium metallireducens]AHF08555.1 hypothetical protein DESME_08835 [Desulfitobacterium metallireducens DSM 15288]
MRIDLQDIRDVGIWVAMILYFFAISYLAEGGQSLLIFFFVIAFSILAIGGLIKSTSKFLEDYYSKKKDTSKL